jgi:tRNAThr (cytosine32-N3)-methyltransferase
MADQPEQYALNASNYWDTFYQRHEEKFFRDRHWFQSEFPELLIRPAYLPVDEPFRILEVGCGVGNSVFPLLRHHRCNSTAGSYQVLACDFSAQAIDLLRSNPEYNANDDCRAFVYDLTNDSQWPPVIEGDLRVQEGSIDVLTMVFVLSAITPQQMTGVVRRMARLLRPGGMILFRDYGRYDMAQLRFKAGRMLQDNFYCRGDGTQVYFFTEQETEELFVSQAGLICEQNMADRRLLVNRLRQLKMFRVWIQGKYRRIPL